MQVYLQIYSISEIRKLLIICCVYRVSTQLTTYVSSTQHQMMLSNQYWCTVSPRNSKNRYNDCIKHREPRFLALQ